MTLPLSLVASKPSGGGAVLNPLQIASSKLPAWYKHDAVVTVDGRISVLEDKTENGNDVPQNNAANRPIVSVGGGPGALDSIFFADSRNDRLRGTGLDVTSSGEKLQVWLVVKTDSNVATTQIVQIGGASDVLHMRYTTTKHQMQYYNPASGLVTAGTSDTNFHLLHTEWDGTTVEFFVDNVSLGTASMSGTQIACTIVDFFKANTDPDCHFVECCIFNDELTAGERALMLTYVNSETGWSL